jgi:hypothetical protein
VLQGSLSNPPQPANGVAFLSQKDMRLKKGLQSKDFFVGSTEVRQESMEVYQTEQNTEEKLPRATDLSVMD